MNSLPIQFPARPAKVRGVIENRDLQTGFLGLGEKLSIHTKNRFQYQADQRVKYLATVWTFFF